MGFARKLKRRRLSKRPGAYALDIEGPQGFVFTFGGVSGKRGPVVTADQLPPGAQVIGTFDLPDEHCFTLPDGSCVGVGCMHDPNPPPPPKGVKWGGPCNRTACQRLGARWWNSSTRAYYCADCARLINQGCRDFGQDPICEERGPE